jgi:hypothetical protein
MPKSRSGYKHRYQPPEGESIPLNEQTFQRLTIVSHYSGRTMGQWCEYKLRQCLALRVTTPPAPPSPEYSPIGTKQRTVELDERLVIEIGIFAQTKGMTARQWLRSILLYCLAIEEERLCGVREQPERFG